MDLPDCIEQEAWDEFVNMRKKIKAPLTDYAKKLALKRLDKFYNSGHDPNEILDQSTLNSWRGLFEVKNGTHQPTVNQESKSEKSARIAANYLRENNCVSLADFKKHGLVT